VQRERETGNEREIGLVEASIPAGACSGGYGFTRVRGGVGEGAYNVQGEGVSGTERHESLDAAQLHLPVTRTRASRYRGTSLIINTPHLGPYSRTIPRVIWRS